MAARGWARPILDRRRDLKLLMEGSTRSLPPECAKCVCVSGSWASGVNLLAGLTSTRVKNLHMHGPTGTIAAGEITIAPSFDVHLF